MPSDLIQAPLQRKRHKSVSVAHVARLAGVSVATAARAFSDSDKLKSETLQKVVEAAEHLNYAPNPLARGLRGGKTNTIGIIWSTTGEPAAATILNAIGAKLVSRGYLSHITDNLDDETEVKSLADYASRSVDGIIFQVSVGRLSERIISLLKRFKAVLLVSQSPVNANFDQLIVDRLAAYREAARHFVDSGRNKIAFVGVNSANEYKYNAFREELLTKEVPLSRDGGIIIGASGLGIAQRFNDTLESKFSKGFPFDAVMCTSDTLAMVLMNWLCRKGYKVPDDVAISGFDDTELCPWSNPPLASVDRRMDEVVEGIDRMIMNRLANPKIGRQEESLSMKFVWRESAGKKGS